jgi:hypothetical protein
LSSDFTPKLLNERLAVLERLFGVVAIRSRNGLQAILQRARRRGDRFQMLFSVLLNFFDLDHDGIPFAD